MSMDLSFEVPDPAGRLEPWVRNFIARVRPTPSGPSLEEVLKALTDKTAKVLSTEKVEEVHVSFTIKGKPIHETPMVLRGDWIPRLKDGQHHAFTASASLAYREYRAEKRAQVPPADRYPADLEMAEKLGLLLPFHDTIRVEFVLKSKGP